MKKSLRFLTLIIGFVLASPLFGTLTPGGGLIVFSTSTYLGPITSNQTLTFDLITTYMSDIEMRLVNNSTNEIVAQINKGWDYYTQTSTQGGGGAFGSAVCNMSSSMEYDFADISSIPDGNYRVEIDMLFPDYWGMYWGVFTPWYQYTNYMYGSYGACYIDVGANYSDVWSWGGASLIL